MEYLIFKGVRRKKKDYTVKEFILRVVSNPLLYGNVKKFPISTIKGETKFQCLPARRSFEDLYRIFKYYFKYLTKEELAKVMIDLALNNEFLFRYCVDIHKWVFYYYKNGDRATPLTVDDDSEYDVYDTKGVGKYSLTDILTLAGITVQEIQEEY